MTTDAELLEKLNTVVLDEINNGNYNLNTICQKIFISRSQLHRRIKRKTGMSTSQYIRKIKLKRAADLLSQSRIKISDLAIKVGINSPQNFSKYFKLEYGMTPTAFRNLNMKPIERVVLNASKRIVKPVPYLFSTNLISH